MGFIFNKQVLNPNGTDYNDYDVELNDLMNSSEIDKKAMAVNLKYDHRVSKERELNFRSHYFEPLGKDLLAALQQHANREIKFNYDPEFCRTYCDSFVADCSDPTSLICENVSEITDLATIVNLNGLGRVFYNTDIDLIKTIPAFLDFDSVEKDSSYFISNSPRMISTIDGDVEIKPTSFDDWIDRRLNQPIHAVQIFIEAIFELLKLRMDKGWYYHPIWVTKWDDFEKYTKVQGSDGTLDIDKWNQVVGVNPRLNSWQIVLKYPASKVDCLYRPTVLDGGFDYPQHFPSPPDQIKQMGGITMDLGIPDNILLPEFIHKQIKLDINYWINAGRLVGQTKVGKYTDKLAQNRNNHHKKLKSKFSPTVINNWMDTPI